MAPPMGAGEPLLTDSEANDPGIPKCCQLDPDAAALFQRSQSRDLRRQKSWHTVPKEEHLGGIHDQHVRGDFIRKVYTVLSLQMAMTTAISYIMMTVPSIKEACFEAAVRSGMLTSILFFIPLVVVLVVLSKNKTNYPCNLYGLFAFTFIMSLNVGFICAIYARVGSGMAVLEAFGLTMAIFLVLTFYACVSGDNFDFLNGFLLTGLVCFMISAIFLMLFPSPLLNMVYSAGGAMLFSAFILFDTHKICKVFGYDDWAIAAIELYLDVINLFLMLVRLLGSR